jgi:hypothetical protein
MVHSYGDIVHSMFVQMRARSPHWNQLPSITTQAQQQRFLVQSDPATTHGSVVGTGVFVADGVVDGVLLGMAVLVLVLAAVVV